MSQNQNIKGKEIKIDNVIELETGAVKFEGELTPEETQLVVELGLNFLVRSGNFNVLERASKDKKDVH